MKNKLLQVSDTVLQAFQKLVVNNRDSVKLQAETGIGYIESINIANQLRKAAEEEPVIFILKRFGAPVGVIIASSEEELAEKLKKAVSDEVMGDIEKEFAFIGDIGTLDWGETLDITVEYIQDGRTLIDVEFSLMKTIHH
jgi:hypothetical protein